MTLLQATQVLTNLPFKGPEMTSIWTRAYAIEAEGIASDHRALIIAVEEFTTAGEAKQ